MFKYLLSSLVLLLSGCALAQHASRNGLPYESWYLGFRAPARMEVWLETADIEDTQGRFYFGMMQGIVSLAYRGDPEGWGTRISSGSGRDIYNAGLPKRIYVRWQSLVEPQTYSAIIDIPETVRQQMLSKAPSILVADRYDYQRFLSIGLAPGGWIKVWVMGTTSEPVEVLCTRAHIEPKGSYQGEYNGEYVKLDPQVREYLKTHSIPYDSWKCPGM
ncbi:DUF2931 family protein [Dyella sp. M7H15-1]|uniref:DUF2931 family protein n=1 Tax=Dyella sp. M7H15-1 TaxID=2501295 RepID=UPI0010050BCA|nr:DUF2931 family protein [Dyella sp. M7H15-1]QAU24191.1 DUF2931 family protein [Dyella sp. M7H15-1]